MSEARSEILGALEAIHPPTATPIQRVSRPGMPSDPVAVLKARVEQAGGSVKRSTRLVSGAELVELVTVGRPSPIYQGPGIGGGSSRERDGAGRYEVECSGSYLLRGFADESEPGNRDGRPDLRSAKDLELCILKGRIAVVENGAVWHVPESPEERAAALLAEHLVLVVDVKDLVATLHDAYDLIKRSEFQFGWFLCGPSKTADIEQALVLGAHGPKTMTLVLIGESQNA